MLTPAYGAKFLKFQPHVGVRSMLLSVFTHAQSLDEHDPIMLRFFGVLYPILCRYSP